MEANPWENRQGRLRIIHLRRSARTSYGRQTYKNLQAKLYNVILLLTGIFQGLMALLWQMYYLQTNNVFRNDFVCFIYFRIYCNFTCGVSFQPRTMLYSSAFAFAGWLTGISR